MRTLRLGSRSAVPCAAARRSRGALTLPELVVVIAIIGILVAITVPAVQQARETARMAQCRNNLRQLGLAMHIHEAAHTRFPSNGWGYLWIGDPDRGTDRHQPGGWIYNILPFVGQPTLRQVGAGLRKPEKSAALKDLMEVALPVVKCPSRPGGSLSPAGPLFNPFNANRATALAKTDYAVNEGDYPSGTGTGPQTLEMGDDPGYAWTETKRVTGIFYQRSETRISEIRDGASNTFMLGEKYVNRSEYSGTGDPGYDQSLYSGVDLDLSRWTIDPPAQDADELGLEPARRFGSAHVGGCHLVLCDGSVRLISYMINRDVHRQLGNRHDGRPAGVATFP